MHGLQVEVPRGMGKGGKDGSSRRGGSRGAMFVERSVNGGMGDGYIKWAMGPGRCWDGRSEI